MVCIAAGMCSAAMPTIQLPDHPDDKPPQDAKRIDEMTLADYRKGVERLMKNLGTLP